MLMIIQFNKINLNNLNVCPLTAFVYDQSFAYLKTCTLEYTNLCLPVLGFSFLDLHRRQFVMYHNHEPHVQSQKCKLGSIH